VRAHDTQLRLAWAFVVGALLLDAFLISQHALVRYQSYHADAFDLGNMDQAIWNTLHGHPFRFTNRGLDWQGPPTRLGLHVEPIFLLLAPLYLIHSGPETLLVTQSIALALGGLPLFLLARRHLPALPLVGAAFVAAYYLSPQLLGEALWDFHPVALATPLLLTALWALDARRYGWFVAAAVLAALTKEDVALSLIPLGLLIWLVQSRPRFGQAVMLLSVAWTALCFFVILPHFSGGAAGGNTYWYRYAWLGSSAGAATSNLATHPWLVLQTVLTSPARLGYLGSIMLLGGGLSIFAPFLWLAALPELAVNLLSSHAEQYSGFFQYNATLIPYLMAAGVYGAAFLYNTRRAVERGEPAAPAVGAADASSSPAARAPARLLSRWLQRVAASCTALVRRVPLPARFVAPIIVSWLLIVGVWSLRTANPRVLAFWTAGSAPIAGQSAMDALLARIPADATVAATDTLDPHLSDRYSIYLVPDPLSYTAEYVALDIPDAVADYQAADRAMFARMQASGHYQVVGVAMNVTLLKRVGAPLPPDPS
jgi:uncharacterized membrane protein